MPKGPQAHELVEVLKRMHREGLSKREAGPMVILFGIIYADEIKACGMSKAKIAKQAIPHSNDYGNEIGKGMKLARYVQPVAITSDEGIELAEDAISLADAGEPD